jgi:hypothetical protein
MPASASCKCDWSAGSRAGPKGNFADIERKKGTQENNNAKFPSAQRCGFDVRCISQRVLGCSRERPSVFSPVPFARDHGCDKASSSAQAGGGGGVYGRCPRCSRRRAAMVLRNGSLQGGHPLLTTSHTHAGRAT